MRQPIVPIECFEIDHDGGEISPIEVDEFPIDGRHVHIPIEEGPPEPLRRLGYFLQQPIHPLLHPLMVKHRVFELTHISLALVFGGVPEFPRQSVIQDGDEDIHVVVFELYFLEEGVGLGEMLVHVYVFYGVFRGALEREVGVLFEFLGRVVHPNGIITIKTQCMNMYYAGAKVI